MQTIQIKTYDSLATLPSNPYREKTEWWEYHLGVKWYAIIAYMDGEPAGFMHAVRHPEKLSEWYFCDVHTEEKFRKQGVATKMYETAFELMSKYDKAYRITASIASDNVASICLHEKLGFHNTMEMPTLTDMTFEANETLYEHYFATRYPAKNVPFHIEVIKAVAGADAKGVLELLEQSGSGSDAEIVLLWAGEVPVGYGIKKGDAEEIKLLPKWERRFRDGCLNIRTATRS